MQTCIWPSRCQCHSLSLASVKSRLVLPFWYRLTRVVPDNGPLNGVSVCIDMESYALSVRVIDEVTNTFSIKHYRIRKFQDGQVGVSSKNLFSSVLELVAYYRGQFR